MTNNKYATFFYKVHALGENVFDSVTKQQHKTWSCWGCERTLNRNLFLRNLSFFFFLVPSWQLVKVNCLPNFVEKCSTFHLNIRRKLANNLSSSSHSQIHFLLQVQVWYMCVWEFCNFVLSTMYLFSFGGRRRSRKPWISSWFLHLEAEGPKRFREDSPSSWVCVFILISNLGKIFPPNAICY